MTNAAEVIYDWLIPDATSLFGCVGW